MVVESEKALVNSFLANRNEKAFRLLYNNYNEGLYAIAMHLTQYNRQVAEDIIQETWIAAIRGLSGFRWECSLKTWLSAIVFNCYRNIRRKTMKQDGNKVSDGHEYHPSSDIKMDIRNALHKLPDGYREILILHDFEGYKHEEIATILGISSGTSKSQLFNARKAIKKILQ